MQNDIVALLKEVLAKHGFTIQDVDDGSYVALKKLKRIGIKNRLIFFYITSTTFLNLSKVQEINKLFNKYRPRGTRTFFYYNIVIVTHGYDKEVLKYITEKMTEFWNVDAAFSWSVLASSVIKVTHLFDLKNKILFYPYDFNHLKKVLHPEITSIIQEVIEKAL